MCGHSQGSTLKESLLNVKFSTSWREFDTFQNCPNNSVPLCSSPFPYIIFQGLQDSISLVAEENVEV